MIVEIEKTGWETFITLINHLCRGQKGILKVVEDGKENILTEAEFISIETYLKTMASPLLMIMFGSGGQIEITHFLKDPTGLSIEQESKKIVELTIYTKKNKVILNFQEKGDEKGEVYHFTLPKTASEAS